MPERARVNLPCFCLEEVSDVMAANVDVIVKLLLLKMGPALKNQPITMTCSDTKQVSIDQD